MKETLTIEYVILKEVLYEFCTQNTSFFIERRVKMEYAIRKANINDSKKLNEFLTKLIQDEKKYDKNINDKCIVHSLYENILHNDNNCILVAEDNANEIVGYLYGYLIDIGDAYLSKLSQLEAIFVDETNRGKNIGLELIEEFKKWSIYNNCKYIELKVCKDNLLAINLYKKQEFKETKIIMTLELKK